MSVFLVPKSDPMRYPSLGPALCDWIEQRLVYGPGPLVGRPLKLDDERRALIAKMYEVYPREHPRAGQRRFDRVSLSQVKGVGKSEFASILAIGEIHPDAPVRFDSWDKKGRPVGRGVVDPHLLFVAFSEKQSDDLCYAAFRKILELSSVAKDFDIGLMRVERRDGFGRAESVSASPNARDGARPTFMVFDETHRWDTPRHRELHTVGLTNLAKRDDSWGLEVTTMFEPGGGSIAESTARYAEQIAEGQIEDGSLFHFYRYASEHHDLTTRAGRLAAIAEAAGPAAAWRNSDRIARLWDAPDADTPYLRRVYLNQAVQGADQAFDVPLWRTRVRDDSPVQEGDAIVLAIDGAAQRTDGADDIALVATHIATGYTWIAGHWTRPLDAPADWTSPIDDVDRTVRELFERYDVWRLYADPFYIRGLLAKWAADYTDQIVEWNTNRPVQMAAALESFRIAIEGGTLSHSGDERFANHLGNARRRNLKEPHGDGPQLWLIEKDRKDSQRKIDLAVATVLAWQARTDAIAAGVTGGRSCYEDPGWQMVVF